MKRSPVTMTLVLGLLSLPLLFATGCSERSGAAELGKPPVAVEVQKIAPTAQTDAIDVVGSLAPRFEASVKPEFSGTVEEVYVTQWVHVKKGQPLAKLDTREGDVLVQKARAGVDSARAALLQAEVRARQADREGERMEQLKSSGLATQQALDDARSNREAAAAQVGAAQSQLRLAEEEVRQAQTRVSKAIMRAPMDGIVADRSASPGDVVGEPGGGTPPFRVVDNRVLELTVTVPTSRLGDIAVGQPLQFTVDAFPGRTFEGKISHINPSVDEASRSVKVIAEVPNSGDELRGGLFARGRIVVGQRTGVLQAPREALMAWDVEKKTGVLYVVEGDLAHRRTVEVGRASGGTVEVAAGIKAGELVVSRGAFNLKDGDKVLVTRTVNE